MENEGIKNGNWYRIEFKIKWDKKSPVNFYIDLIIIDLLINPAVKKFKFAFWTFHRSAHPTDKDGHMLKFNFYTNREIAEAVFNHVKSNPDYNRIENYLEEIKFRDDIGGFSSIADENWPSEIRISWPCFIKGVCEMYINLINEIKNNKVIDRDKNNDIEGYYREIEKEIDEKWFKYGSHSYLHHLGAIFGYKLIYLQPRFWDENSKGIIL